MRRLIYILKNHSNANLNKRMIQYCNSLSRGRTTKAFDEFKKVELLLNLGIASYKIANLKLLNDFKSAKPQYFNEKIIRMRI